MIIKTLRRKFIAATMLSLAAVLLVILGGVNLMSYQKVISDADAILELLCANSGTFPEFPTGKRPAQAAAQPPISADKPGFGDRGLSPETPYESRYFSVVLDETGQVVYTDTVQIAAIDDDTAASYAQAVWQSGRTSGFWEDYRYACRSEANGWRIIFLDCGRTLSGFRTTLLASVMLALVGLGAVLKVALSDLSEQTLEQIDVIAIGDSDALEVGEQVVAIGNALGYGQSVTTGIVSALNRSITNEDGTTSTYIQTDAAINPGNSGGALLNLDGELIGINTAKLSSTDVEGMGYAIPISDVMERIAELMTQTTELSLPAAQSAFSGRTQSGRSV